VSAQELGVGESMAGHGSEKQLCQDADETLPLHRLYREKNRSSLDALRLRYAQQAQSTRAKSRLPNVTTTAEPARSPMINGRWTHMQVGAILHPFEGASVGAG
jgi:hypothetical protein